MVSKMPGPVLILLATVVESLAITFTSSQYLPDKPLTYVFLRLLILQFCAYFFYRHSIYPRFFSPLRYLPRAKVGDYETCARHEA